MLRPVPPEGHGVAHFGEANIGESPMPNIRSRPIPKIRAEHRCSRRGLVAYDAHAGPESSRREVAHPGCPRAAPRSTLLRFPVPPQSRRSVPARTIPQASFVSELVLLCLRRGAGRFARGGPPVRCRLLTSRNRPPARSDDCHQRFSRGPPVPPRIPADIEINIIPTIPGRTPGLRAGLVPRRVHRPARDGHHRWPGFLRLHL